ncbi:MAG TPA: G5 domain-containing protein [Candidatus Coprocola pullicola]|nr:G5 domain-containing protein [Candidatus Coprocola pullicola]
MDSKGNFPKREERIPYGRAIRNEETQKKGTKKNKKKLSPYKQKYNAQHNIKPVKRKKLQKRSISAKNRRILALIIAILAIVLILLFVFRQNGKEVFIGETSMGIVEDKSVTADSLLQTLTAQLQQEVGANVKINETIEVKPLHISKARQKDVCQMDYLMPLLRQKVTYQVEAAAITVDGKETVIVANQQEADAVFTALQEPYKQQDETRNIQYSFQEDVQVVLKYVDPSQIAAKENAVQTLQSGTRVPKEYTVQSGDALYKIAAKFDMTQEELKQMNADLIPQNGTVNVGWVLNVMAEVPMVSVKTTETVVLTEVEKYNVVYQQDSSKNKGYQKVTQQGKDGQKEVTKEIVRINGELTSEEVVSEKITVEPIDEIVVQGTK